MRARIKAVRNTLNNKVQFAVCVKGCTPAKFQTKQLAKEYATKKGYVLVYSG